MLRKRNVWIVVKKSMKITVDRVCSNAKCPAGSSKGLLWSIVCIAIMARNVNSSDCIRLVFIIYSTSWMALCTATSTQSMWELKAAGEMLQITVRHWPLLRRHNLYSINNTHTVSFLMQWLVHSEAIKTPLLLRPHVVQGLREKLSTWSLSRNSALIPEAELVGERQAQAAAWHKWH